MANNYQVVTDRIVAMLEQGVRPWAKSWKAGEPVSLANMVRPMSGATGRPYTGINVINLWCAAESRGFTSPYWFTFKAAKDAGGNVKKGAKAELAFFVGRHTVKDEAPGQDPTERTISFLRAYCVFNACECEGLPAKFYPGNAEPAPVVDGRIDTADAFIAATGASIAHGGDRAFFMPSADAIRLPHITQFESPEAYYATSLHELIHWTGPEARCNREMGKRFGDDAYAAEELVAELGAAFAMADLSISAEPREDHASYLAGWLKIMKADNRAIFRAAALAEKAAAFLHAQQPAADEPEHIELAMAA
jgi:antirestriction protein ArdC